LIDYNGFYTELIGAVSDMVGCSLSTIRTETGTRASVIRRRTNAPRPNTTFITVDVEDTWLPSGWLLDERLNDDNNPEYTILLEMQTVIRCYGKDATQILQGLTSYMTLPNFRARMKDSTGASISSQGNVRSIPQILSTDYEERSEIIVRWLIHDTLIDLTNNCAEEVPDGIYFDSVSTETEGTQDNGIGTIKVGFDGEDILVNFNTNPIT